MRQGFVYIIIITLFVFSGCTYNISEKNKKPPANLISRDEMVDIITDLHLYDAVMKEKQNSHNDILKSKYYLYQTVMEKYNITREQFESSVKYYQRDLDEYDGIYEDVIAKLSKMKAEADSK